MALQFGVKKLDDTCAPPSARDDTGAPPSARDDDARIAFFCPGCGKSFEQSVAAAGKKTQCPACETTFAIPAAARLKAPRAEPATEDPGDIRRSPGSGVDTEAAIAAAVAAYNAGKTQPAKSPRWIIPTAIGMLLLGGILSVMGSVLMVRGYWKAFGIEDLMSGKGLGLDQVMGGVFGGRNQVMQDLLNDIDNPNRRRPQQQPAHTGITPGKVAEKLKGQQADIEKQLAERQAKREAGMSLVTWGVITHGAGKLFTWIGGIFLLAAVLGRILRPREPSPA